MYTYLIGWRKLDKWYYGSRVANKKPPKDDLFCDYFTSSRFVKMFIEEHGIPDSIRIHKEFETSCACRLYEERFLKCVGAKDSLRWLNKNDTHAPPVLCGENNGFFGKTHTNDLKAKWSKTRKGKIISFEIRKKLYGRIPWNRGKRGCFSAESVDKMRSARFGKDAWNKGKRGCYSVETIKKMSTAKRGRIGHKHTNETKNKISNKRKGRKWYYDPTTMNCICSDVCPYGYVLGMIKKGNGRMGYKHSDETKLLMSKSARRRIKNDRKEN